MQAPAVPHTPAERARWAFYFGHQWNPAREYANLLNLDEGRVAKMNGSEADAKLLVSSWQQLDANVETLVEGIHGRALQADGEVGPASEAVLAMRRCAMPDFPPPPNASFHYDDPGLQAAVESMQAAAQITGPYWRGCDAQRPDVHSVVIGIDTKNASSNFLANQDKILQARIACAAEIGVAVRFVINPQSLDGLQQYQVHIYIAGGVIGYNYFPQSNSCGRIPNGRIDNSYNPSDWRLHANLGTHESEGHGFGINHTRGGIMNPSIVLVWPLSWKGDAGWSQIAQYYPGKPLTPTIPPVPPTPVPGPVGTVLWDGVVPAGGRLKLVHVPDQPTPVPTKPVPT